MLIMDFRRCYHHRKYIICKKKSYDYSIGLRKVSPFLSLSLSHTLSFSIQYWKIRFYVKQSTLWWIILMLHYVFYLQLVKRGYEFLLNMNLNRNKKYFCKRRRISGKHVLGNASWYPFSKSWWLTRMLSSPAPVFEASACSLSSTCS